MQACRECPLSSSLFSEIEYRSGFSLERGLQTVLAAVEIVGFQGQTGPTSGFEYSN